MKASALLVLLHLLLVLVDDRLPRQKRAAVLEVIGWMVKNSTFWAMVVSWALMILYVAIRFESPSISSFPRSSGRPGSGSRRSPPAPRSSHPA